MFESMEEELTRFVHNNQPSAWSYEDWDITPPIRPTVRFSSIILINDDGIYTKTKLLYEKNFVLFHLPPQVDEMNGALSVENASP